MGKVLIKNIGCLQTPVGSYSHKGSKQGANKKYINAAIAVEDNIDIERAVKSKLAAQESIRAMVSNIG